MTTQDKLVELPLEGVESEHCALIVDKGLAGVKGIRTHQVELNNRRALIGADDPASVLEAIRAIRDLGYGVPTVQETFGVTGMSCASCAVSVESVLKAQPGVEDASVNFAGNTVQVRYVPGAISPDDMKRAVQSIGYDLVVDTGDGAGSKLEEIRGRHYAEIKRKTILASLFTIPTAVIGMFLMDMPGANWIMWALSTPVIVWFGRGFFINAWKQLRHRSANMDTLVALSTGVAYLFSVFNTLFPEVWHQRGLHAHVYFEAAAVVITFILLGKLLEERAKGKTSDAIRKLMGLQPGEVTLVLPDGNYRRAGVDAVVPDDLLLVKPGERIAVDGRVVEGESFVDESMLSGEPLPVTKSLGSPLYSGTINQAGSLVFRAEKVGKDTVLARIVKMVQHAQGSKAPVQKLVDRIAAVFVPVVILIALLTLVAWFVFGGADGITQGLLSMITVLVIACPCALGLATPTAIMVGVGKGAERGILIKDAQSLETAKRVNAVVLDKTGTLTEGKPAVVDAFWVQESARHRQILAAIEHRSEHPLAIALVSHLGQQEPVAVEEFRNLSGRGVRAIVRGKGYYVGSDRLMVEQRIPLAADTLLQAESWKAAAHTIIWFADEHRVLALFAVADRVKTSSAQAVRQLQESGIKVHMLTGDQAAVAESVARSLNIGNVKAEASPEDKVEYIRTLQRQGKTVAMVGDGINDSAALAQADLSMAMGKGSDIAMEVAGVTIISSDLLKIGEAIKLSRMTVATVRQNLFWAFIYNLIGIPIAAGLLYPFTGFLINPMVAGAAMALSSVSVVSNSLRLKWSA